MSAPASMTAVVLNDYTGGPGLTTEEVPVPELTDGSVLIEVAASPINPSDVLFLSGEYGFRPRLPTRPGFEGAGVVVGSVGEQAAYLEGRRVSFMAGGLSGAWAEYVAVPGHLALPLNEDVSLEVGSMGSVNPLTALAFLDLAREQGHTSVVNTAAAGALGRMIDRVFSEDGMTVINVVRRGEQAEALSADGCEIVLDSSAEGFGRELRSICREHSTGFALDAVGGAMTRRLLRSLVDGGTVVVYGALAGQPSQAEPADFVFRGMEVTGFWLSRWLPQRTPAQNAETWAKAQSMMGHTLASDVAARFPLSEAQEAVASYVANMSAGKVLFTPNGD